MKRAIHAATVVPVPAPMRGYQGQCLETGLVSYFLGIPQDGEAEGKAIARALSYLGRWSSNRALYGIVCNAEHRMAHDLAATPKGGRA